MTFIGLILFLLPYLILGFHILAQSGANSFLSQMRETLFAHGDELLNVLVLSAAQSVVSSVLIVAFGLAGAIGLLSLKDNRYFSPWRVLIMSPALLPSAFATISGIHFFKTFGYFTHGFWGVVALHVILYAGLAAVLLERVLRGALSGAIELATVEGAKFGLIFKVVLLGLKAEIASVVFLFLVFTFTSFSVPLIVGAQSGLTLEVLLYKSILSRGDLHLALMISLLQLMIIYFISVWVPKRHEYLNMNYKNNETLSNRYLLYFFSFISLALVLFNLQYLPKGFEIFFQILSENSLAASTFFRQVIGTAIQSLLSGFFALILMVLLLFAFQNSTLYKILLGYSTPSVAMIGFCVYILFDSPQLNPEIVYILMALTFVITLLPLLFRLRLFAAYESLGGQLQMARVMGARHRQVVFEILLPQLGRELFFMSGLAAFWASGDFALSSIVTGQELTLGLVLKNLMGGYHLELSTVYGLMSVVAGLCVFAFFEGCGRVFDTKFNSSVR